MPVTIPPLPTVGGSTGIWGQGIVDAFSNLVGQLSNLDNVADANKPVSTPMSVALSAKAPLTSPAFAGVPTAPTASSGTSTTQIATTGFVAAAVAAGGGGGGGGANYFTYLQTPGTASANTTTINTALATAAAAGGGVVVLGVGTWQHTGITFPAGGYVQFVGVSKDGTFLSNTTTSAPSISAVGVGGSGSRPYASGFEIKDMTLTTSSGAVRAGQYGIALTLAAMFKLSNVAVYNHDEAFRFISCWEFHMEHCLAFQSGAVGYHFVDGFAGSTPITVTDSHSIGATGSALVIDNNVNALTWVGGDVLAHAGGAVKILGSTTRLVELNGLNFEGNTGADIQIGNSSGTATYPGVVTIINTRHHHGGSTGNASPQPVAIDHQTGGDVNVIGSYFSGYTTAIKQSNVTNSLHWQGIAADSVTNLIQGQPNGTTVTLTAGKGSISPSGYTTADGSGTVQASQGIKLTGYATMFTLNGFDPYAGLGAIGDFCFRADGATGHRIFTKTSATVWTPWTTL